MKIRHIHVKGLGSFDNFDINLTTGDDSILDVAVIVGENNSGKSLLLNAIVSCLTSTQKSGRYRGEIIQLEGKSEIQVITDYGVFVQTVTMNGTEIDPNNRMIVYFDSRRTMPIGKEAYKNGQQFFPRSSDTSLAKTDVQGRGCDRLVAIEKQLLMIKQESEKIFIKALMVMTEIVKPHYTVKAHGNSIVCYPEGRHNSIPLNEIGDGFKSLLIIVGELLCRYITANHSLIKDDSYMTEIRAMSAICLIDNLELHLHPKLQVSIISRLRQIFPKTQFIITTHAPLIISELAPNSIFQLIDKRKELHTIDEQLDNKKDPELKPLEDDPTKYRCPKTDVMTTTNDCIKCDEDHTCSIDTMRLDKMGNAERAERGEE